MIRDAQTTVQMLIDHMDKHIDQALEIAVYVFRWPVESVRVMTYTDKPFRQLILDTPGLLTILLEVELKPNILNPNTVDTYIKGDLAEFISYLWLEGGGYHQAV